MRVLDPGCGNGDALVTLSSNLGMVPYGCELNSIRAETARSAVTSSNNPVPAANVINDDFINIQTQRGSFHILYLNPPYDWEQDSGREEYRWLKKMRPLLAPGGLLIWIIPERILTDKNVRRFMYSWFDDMTVYRFPGEEYNLYKQVVLYGIHRTRPQAVTAEFMRPLVRLSETKEFLQEHPVFENPIYVLDNIRVPDKFWFWGLKPDPEAISLELASHGLSTRHDFRTLLTPAGAVKLDPLVPMKVGHITATIAAGHINNKRLTTSDGSSVLIKGSVYNEPVTTVTQEQTDSRIKTKTITVNDPRSVISTIDDAGNISNLKNDSLVEFLESNLSEITDKLVEMYPPRYRFQLGEWAGWLKGINPRRIPNTNRMGLLPAQKHSAVAVCVQWEKYDGAILIGQLGTGKTIISIAAAYAQYMKNNNRDHFIVMCPPHLVLKWIREIGLTWPDAKSINLSKVSHVDRFFATTGPIFGVLKSTAAAAGGGWTHRLNMAGPLALKQRTVKQRVTILEGNPRLEEALASDESQENFLLHQRFLSKSLITCPTCGSLITVQDRKNAGGRLPATLSDFTQKRMWCNNKSCNAPLWQDERNGKPRYPIATYIKRHYKGFVDIAIVDEAHQYKGESSDRGHAYARVVEASRKVLAMTGTIYGGKASTLFFLLFRLSKDFRRSWVDKSQKSYRRMMLRDWSKTYGVMEETITMSEDTSSKSTGTMRPSRNIREIAGSSPAMLPWLLNRSVFVSLADMGIALPNFQEFVVEAEMSAPMKEQYDFLYNALSTELSKRLVRGDRSLLSKYLYALLFWPDSPWRPKVVQEEGKEAPLVSIPGTGLPVGSHPKEKAIMDLIQDELSHGRHCLLMVEQTNTLDIQPDWQNYFAQNNISSAILKADANKREAWIHAQEKKGTQVLISHPRKVETGLDILGYPTIIWMCPNFSIYTVTQASGRAYRLGQTKDCKVYFFAYTDTLQGQALRLIIAKAASAKRVNGDTIQTDDLADLDRLASDSIENTLAKVITKGVEANQELIEIDLDYEQVKDGIFTGRFTDCDDAEAAETLYATLVAETAIEGSIDTLATLFAKANADYKNESVYTTGDSITTDDDPDIVFVSDDKPEEPAALPEEPAGIVITLSSDNPIVVESNDEDITFIVEAPEEVVSERLVFGQSAITISPRKKKVKKLAVPAQLSLF